MEEYNDRSPIFIGGCRRSGVGLMGLLLDRHPALASAGDSRLFTQTSFEAFHQYFEAAWRSRVKRYGLKSDVVDEMFAAFVDHAFTRLAYTRGKNRWTEGAPGNELHIAFIRRLFPGAYFIHMTRDPRDIYCSRAAQTSLNPADTPEETAHAWVIDRQLARARQSDGRYLEVRYEDLALAPLLIVERVCASVGVTEPTYPSLDERDGLAAADSTIDLPALEKSVGRWRRELGPDEAARIEVVTGPLMNDTGNVRKLTTEFTAPESNRARMSTSATDLQRDDLAPIFIGGQRRSGTSLVRVLLNRHLNIACGPEAVFPQDASFALWHGLISHQWGKCLAGYGLTDEDVDASISVLIHTFFAQVQAREGKHRWAEKTPGNITRIDYLARLFPHAQFVHVIRDPRDVYCSIRQRARRDKPEWERFTARRSAIDWSNSIVTGKRWRERTARYLEIRYEDVATQPEATMRRCLAFLHEPWDPGIFDRARDTTEAEGDAEVQNDRVVSSHLGRWKSELQSDEVRWIESIAGPLMKELGYDPVTT